MGLELTLLSGGLKGKKKVLVCFPTEELGFSYGKQRPFYYYKQTVCREKYNHT